MQLDTYFSTVFKNRIVKINEVKEIAPELFLLLMSFLLSNSIDEIVEIASRLSCFQPALKVILLLIESNDVFFLKVLN